MEEFKPGNNQLSRVPNQLTEGYNFDLLANSLTDGGSILMDVVIFLSNHQMKDLFGDIHFSLEDFCSQMGHNRTQMQRKLTPEQLKSLFGQDEPPIYEKPLRDGVHIHKIENIFEAALWKCTKENLTYIAKAPDGGTSYRGIQIITRFDINYDFTTKKKTKRVYSVKLSPKISDFLFNHYSLVELADYKQIPDRRGYRYFYLCLSKMIIVVKYKMKSGVEPFYSLTVDQLAKMFEISVTENKEKKRRVTQVLSSIQDYMEMTQFSFEYVKGDKQVWAYTVRFNFPEETLSYFDEKYNAVFKKAYYDQCGYLYISLSYNKAAGSTEQKRILEEIRQDPDREADFLEWLHSDIDKDKKVNTYKFVFKSIFNQLPEELGIESGSLLL